MAVIYPKYEKIRQLKVPPTKGELVMLDFLIETLDDEYEIYFQPFLNGDSPDIVIMREGGGVLVIEVKDWQLEHYYIDKNSNWFVKRNNAQVKSPIMQVLKYKENIYNLHIHNLLNLKLKNYKYWYVVACSLFFLKESNNSIISFLSSRVGERKNRMELRTTDDGIIKKKETDELYIEHLKKNIEIIGNDNLNSDYFNEVLHRRWISRNSKYFNEDLYISFKRYLKPSFHSQEDGRNIKYSKQQSELTLSKPGEQKIRGVVGSGKTMVLAKRAVNAHKRTNEKVLTLTFNISLKNYIHDRISDVREDFYWINFRILNYHDFINAMMNNLGIEFKIPKDFDSWTSAQRDYYFENNYYGNVDLFNGYNNQIERYPTIIIDEVQDYQTNWLRLIKKFFLDVNGEFVVFGDSKQDIYNRVSLVNNKKELVIPDSPGRWSELNKTFRFTPTISDFVLEFQKKYLIEKHSIDSFEKDVNQEISFDNKIHHKYFNCFDGEEIAKFIRVRSIDLGSHPNDICILALSIEVIQEIDYYYRKISNEKTYIMAETKECKKEAKDIRKNKKMHFWMNSGVTKFSTIHSFKGWEIDTLFLVVQKGVFESSYKELIYTGFTRCMRNLILVNIGDKELSSFINQLSYVKKY